MAEVLFLQKLLDLAMIKESMIKGYVLAILALFMGFNTTFGN